MSATSNPSDNPLDIRIEEILKEKEVNIPERLFPDVVATLFHAIRVEKDLEYLPYIIREEERVARLTDAAAFDPDEWYSKEELSELDLEAIPQNLKIEAWERDIDSRLRTKFWEKAIENVYKRLRWNVLVVSDDKEEERGLVSAIANAGYNVVTSSSEEALGKVEGLSKRGVMVVSGLVNQPRDTIYLQKVIDEKFPGVSLLAAIKGGSEEGRAVEYEAILTARKIPYVNTYHLNVDELVMKLDTFIRDAFIKGYALEDGKAKSRKSNYMFLLMGPTCAGKSEISARVVRKMSGITLGKKSTTRAPRHSGEDEIEVVEPFGMRSRPDRYFARWQKAGAEYGLKKTILIPFEQEGDVIVPVTNLGALDDAEGYAQEKYGDVRVMVPIMITSDPGELRKRLAEREFSQEERKQNLPALQERYKGLEEEVRLYNDNLSKFISIIINNSSFYSQEELEEDRKVEDLNTVVGRLQRCIKWLRQQPRLEGPMPEYHQRFVDDVIGKLSGYGSFDGLLDAQKEGQLSIRFNEDEIRNLINERDYPVDYMDYGRERRLVAAMKSHGRAVLLLESYGEERKNGIDPDTDFFSGLVEKKLGRAWRKQDASHTDEGNTIYGLVKCPGAQFRGGMHFAITDVFPFPTEKTLYAVDIAYVSSGDGDVGKISSFGEDELRSLRERREKEINILLGDMQLITTP